MKKKPYVGMHYKCCKIYQRIYLNRRKTAFVGYCPKCTIKVELKVDPSGAKSKFFQVQ